MKATLHKWHNTKRVLIYGTSDMHYDRVSNNILIYKINLRKCTPKEDIISNKSYLFQLIKAEELYDHSVRYGQALSLIKNPRDIIPDVLHA